MPGWDGTAQDLRQRPAKSTTGKAEGPYVDMQPAERLGDEIDASLFEDDDGTVYFLWHSGKIARLKPDMSGLAEPYHWLKTTAADPDPKHHSGLCAGIFGKDSFDHVGYEGMFLFKATAAITSAVQNSSTAATVAWWRPPRTCSAPTGERYEAIPHGGHNTFFKDDQGQWWSTFFGPPYSERAAILPVHFDGSGRLLTGKANAPRSFPPGTSNNR